MTVTLGWQGPLGPGKMPLDPIMMEPLCAAGVYLRVKIYKGGRTVAYVGQSKSLLARFDQHLTSMLSLTVPIRGTTGKKIFTADVGARMEAYNRLEAVSSLAAADVMRVKFWYVFCDDYFQAEHLNLVEGLLQQRIKSRLSNIENVTAAPSNMLEAAPDLWENDFSNVDRKSEKILEELLGPDRMSAAVFGSNAG